MYGTHQAQGGQVAGVKVEASAQDRRLGQQFRADLEDKLNPGGAVPSSAKYRLVASLSSASTAIGVARDGTVSRYNVNLTSNYELYRVGETKPVTKGSLRHVSSYNNLVNQYYSTYISEQDAINRGITELSELFRQRLSPYLATSSAL
jgi:hypothetical protein